MAESNQILKDEEGGEEEHEEGEISDEDAPPPSGGEKGEGESPASEENEVAKPTAGLEAATSSGSGVRESSVMQRLAGLDDTFEIGNNELRAGQNRKRTDAYRGRAGRDLGSSSLKRNGWPTYGSLTQFAWTQAVSGQAVSGRAFNTGADLPTLEGAEDPKLSKERRVLSRSGSSGSWSTDAQKKLSRTFSRDSETYERSTGRSSEERDDLSPLREISSRLGERLGERVSDSIQRGRSRETSWSDRERELLSSRVVRSRIENNGGSAEGLDPRRGLRADSVEGRSRKQRSPEAGSPNGTSNDGDVGPGSSSWTNASRLGQDAEDKGDAAEDREEGELEEGEIELLSLPADRRSESPSKETQDTGRQSNYSGIREADDWAKERLYARSYSSKSNSRFQIDDYSSRRYRQPRPQESIREKQLSMAGELVKNVTVKDAQRSFVDVCGRLHKALKVLDEVHTMFRQDVYQEGREESLPVAITGLSRQAFAGIRAVYAVRNTASGREQERDKNIFPRLLELANGYCQKLFTPKQVRELQVMMQTIANAGRVMRNGDTEKVQYPREPQPQPGPPEKSIDNEAKPASDFVASKGGSIKTPFSNKIEQPKTSDTELSLPGRILGFVDAKQAKEAASLAAAALAYAKQNSAAAAACTNPLIGNTNDSRSTPSAPAPAPAQPQGPVPWGWPSSESSLQVQFPNLAMNALKPNNRIHNPTMVKFASWSAIDQHISLKLSGQQDGYGAHPVEAKAKDATATIPNPASLQLQGSKGGVGVSSGYSTVLGTSTALGMLDVDWERLSPSAGDAMPSVASSPAVLPSQAAFGGATTESSSRGMVWPSRPEVGAYEIARGGTGRQYPLDQHLLDSNQQRNVDAPPLLYTMERLPSPTPDENEDIAPQPPPAIDITPGFRAAGVNKMPSTVPPHHQGNNKPSSISTLGSVQILKRSQSLDGQAAPAVVDPNLSLIEKPPQEPALLSTTKSSDDADSIKNAGASSLPPKGPFRKRDPRRQFQSHSLDFLEMDGLDQSSNQVVNSRPDNSHFAGGAPVGSGTNKRRFVPDMDEAQDSEMQKRLKVQSESSPDVNGFNMEHGHGSSATGGWLDDNVEPSFGAAEDVSTGMEVDGEGPTVGGLDERRGLIGSEVKVKNDGRLTFLPDSMNTTSANKRMMDFGQQVLDSGNRKMRPRDPRRAYIENKVERGDGSFTDNLRANDMSALMSSSVEVGGSLPRATAEADSWNKKDVMLGPGNKQGGASVQNIAPNFAERMTNIAVTVGGSSAMQVAKSQHLASSGVGQVVSAGVAVTKAGRSVQSSVGIDSTSAVFSEVVSHQEFSEQSLEKSTPGNLGPTRKPKGNASQWGASQVHPGLEQLLEDLTDEERRSVQLERKRRMEEQDRMFSAGKLCLVLDLDHTLLNSAKFSEIEQEWDQRLRVAETAERNRVGRDGLERRELYRFPHMSMWTKLRPGIWKFLAKASQLYELHVYTMGNKVYATEMAKVLDPTGKLFAGRVISKGDDGDGDDLLPKSKDLDGVLGMESAVVIIDDSARVWPHHSGNLIVVERYMYFPCSRRQFGLAGPSLLEVGHDERESDGMLASALGVIDKIHQKVFKNPRLREVDVREILAAQQRQVLAGCKVVFSRVFPVGEAEPHRHPLWRTAEQFGAICTIAIDDMVTHVVAISLGTDKVNWALETGRYVVRPAWLEASTILYRRANEREFPVLPQ